MKVAFGQPDPSCPHTRKGVPAPSVGDDATTPEWVLELVRKVAPIGLDPCWNSQATTNPRKRFDGTDHDGLESTWAGATYDDELAYVNPPYGRGQLVRWARKMADEASGGVEIVALVPADPSTKWFAALSRSASECVLLGRRVKFGGHGAHSKGPSAVFYFGEREGRFLRAFGPHGLRVVCGGSAQLERMSEAAE